LEGYWRKLILHKIFIMMNSCFQGDYMGIELDENDERLVDRLMNEALLRYESGEFLKFRYDKIVLLHKRKIYKRLFRVMDKAGVLSILSQDERVRLESIAQVKKEKTERRMEGYLSIIFIVMGVLFWIIAIFIYSIPILQFPGFQWTMQALNESWLDDYGTGFAYFGIIFIISGVLSLIILKIKIRSQETLS